MARRPYGYLCDPDQHPQSKQTKYYKKSYARNPEGLATQNLSIKKEMLRSMSFLGAARNVYMTCEAKEGLIADYNGWCLNKCSD